MDAFGYIASRYTPDQIRKMEESIQLRKQLEPVELINVVRPLLGFWCLVSEFASFPCALLDEECFLSGEGKWLKGQTFDG